MSFSRFLFFWFLLSLTMSTVILISHFVFPVDYERFLWLSLGISAVMTLISFSITQYGLSKNQKIFLNFLVMGMMFKILTGLLFVLVALKFWKEFLYEFIIAFFITYVIYTVFEVLFLMKKLKTGLKK